ncbi:hypothetical protein [Confluentibacter citreus]|uniref:hypothetical protein n=1 Tax=Confluentibacter citreus TaxID=2007307 RepID=UPI000C2925AE|nr:hypothetical protein [Confluentibacter citreus]
MKVIYCVFILLFLSCQKEDINPIEDVSLIGKWTEIIEAKPQGLLIYELTLNTNSTFILKINQFGIYPTQSNQDISAWTEFSGTFEQKPPNTLILKAGEYSWWDDFYDMTPISEASNAQVFENCTYKIINDTLELTYTTYPADSPIETKKVLTKVK